MEVLCWLDTAHVSHGMDNSILCRVLMYPIGVLLGTGHCLDQMDMENVAIFGPLGITNGQPMQYIDNNIVHVLHSLLSLFLWAALLH